MVDQRSTTTATRGGFWEAHEPTTNFPTRVNDVEKLIENCWGRGLCIMPLESRYAPLTGHYNLGSYSAQDILRAGGPVTLGNIQSESLERTCYCILQSADLRYVARDGGPRQFLRSPGCT